MANACKRLAQFGQFWSNLVRLWQASVKLGEMPNSIRIGRRYAKPPIPDLVVDSCRENLAQLRSSPGALGVPFKDMRRAIFLQFPGELIPSAIAGLTVVAGIAVERWSLRNIFRLLACFASRGASGSSNLQARRIGRPARADVLSRRRSFPESVVVRPTAQTGCRAASVGSTRGGRCRVDPGSTSGRPTIAMIRSRFLAVIRSSWGLSGVGTVSM